MTNSSPIFNKSNLIPYCIVAAIIWAVYTIMAFYAEIVPDNDGLGWDGVIYNSMVLSFPSNLFDNSLSPYYAARLLPIAFCKLFLITFTLFGFDINVVDSFKILNVLSFGVILIVWYKIALSKFNDLLLMFLGLVLIFVNFIFIKQSTFLPVTIDIFALAFAFLIVYANIAKSFNGLVVIAALSAFVWQLNFYYGLLSLLFFGVKIQISNLPKITWKYSLAALPLCLIVLFLIGIHQSYIKELIILFMEDFRRLLIFSPSWSSKVSVDMIFVKMQQFVTGIPALILVLPFVLSFFWILAISLSKYLKCLHKQNLIFCGLVLVLAKTLIWLVSNPNVIGGNTFLTLGQWAFFPLAQPYTFYSSLLSPLLLYGCGVALFLYWPTASVRAMSEISLSSLIIFILSLPLILPTEPRYILSIFPILTVCVCMSLKQRVSLSPLFVLLVFILNLLLSKFYIDLQAKQWGSADGSLEQLFILPRQLLFSTYGPWMSFESYQIQSIITIISMVCLSLFVKKFVTNNLH